jgi:hypothetical protein
MSKKPDFSKPVPPPAKTPPSHTPPAAFGPNRPPLRIGEPYLSESSKKELGKIGWNDGDPVPPDLAQRLKEMRAEITKEKETAKLDLPDDFKPTIAKQVNIEDLPPERRQELEQYLVQYREQVQQEQAVRQGDQAREDAMPEGVHPSLIEAQQVAAAAEAAAGPTVAVIDDRDTVPKPEKPDSVPPTITPPDESNTGAQLRMTHCPRCMWDLNDPFELELGEADKRLFLAVLLGGNRYKREVTLLDGRMVVAFRSLTPQEVTVINQQLGMDVRAQKITGDAEWLLENLGYRMIASIERLTVDNDVIAEVPALLDIPHANPLDNETVLIPMRDWFYKNVAKTELMQHVLATQFRLFQRLVEALETKVADENFWKGIELPA